MGGLGPGADSLLGRSEAARVTLGGDKAASATYFAVYGFAFLGRGLVVRKEAAVFLGLM